MRQDKVINRALVDYPPGMNGNCLVFLIQGIKRPLLGKGCIRLEDYPHQEMPLN